MSISQDAEGKTVILTPDDNGTVALVAWVEVIPSTGMYALQMASLISQDDEPKVIDQVIKMLTDRKEELTNGIVHGPRPIDLLPIPKGPTSSISNAAPDRSPIVSNGPIERDVPSDDRYYCSVCGRHYVECDH
jgi:hypothetical protein